MAPQRECMLSIIEQRYKSIKQMKHIQTHNLELTKEELTTIIQSIECFIDNTKPRWAKDEAEDDDIILLLNKLIELSGLVTA
jgi:hypothetical protein